MNFLCLCLFVENKFGKNEEGKKSHCCDSFSSFVSFFLTKNRGLDFGFWFFFVFWRTKHNQKIKFFTMITAPPAIITRAVWETCPSPLRAIQV